jgi:4-hydroxy-tetrahydrodipicolinate reductase
MSLEPIRVAVAGARGRTGSVVVEALRAAPGLNVVGALVRPDGALGEQEYDSLANLAAQARPAVLVDFTVFPASKAIVLEAIARGMRPVIGTTGYGERDLQEVRAAADAARLGAVYAANFSIGALLLMRFAKMAAPYFGHAEVIETHHTGKKDAPSGTALALARTIGETGPHRRARAELLRVEGACGADVDGVGIHSLRLPGVLGVHEVRFAGEDESVSAAHTVTSRRAFVAGVTHAVRAVVSLNRFVEGLEDILP